MTSRLGIYDIFSRIVPGGFYLGTFLEFARIIDLIDFDWVDLKDVGVLASLALALVAFVLGSAMDRLGYAWQRLFRPSYNVLDEFRREHNDLRLGFEAKDWAILRAYVYINNLNVGDEIDRHNALSIMMRNVSFGLFLLAICEGIRLLQTEDWRFLFLVLFLLFLSYQTGVQARSMREWFYRSIFETIIAYRLRVEGLVKPARSSRRKRTDSSDPPRIQEK